MGNQRMNPTRERKFKRFNDAWQVWKEAGYANTSPEAEQADKLVDYLKPYIDRHWDEYQTWKENNGR
jgi:hypothetical protein